MGKASILIVEDEAIVAADLSNILRKTGYEIRGMASRGEEAVALTRSRQPDLVLMDIRLAGPMDGVEAAQRIRAECDVPVIYLTAHSDRATLERAKVTEPFGYILKPFEHLEVESQIEMALYKHQAERQLRESRARLQEANAKLHSNSQELAVRNQQLATASAQLQLANEQLEQRVMERTVQLRALAAELTQAEERERRRLAQTFHDDLQQRLVGARLLLEAMRGEADLRSVEKSRQRLERLISESLDISRGLTRELSPLVLHEQGLVAALKWLSSWIGENHGLCVVIKASTAVDPIEENVRILLFRSVRELLLNVVKHAQVKRACVRVARTQDSHLEIVVSDKGRGFNPTRERTGYETSSGFGLFSIRERLALLGGSMEVLSSPGCGSRFRLLAPFHEQPRREAASLPLK